MGDSYHHTAILQRLNVYHKNDGRNVYYSLSAFENVSDWDGIPVIMSADPTTGHPSELIGTTGVPAGYRVVGHISDAKIPEEGTARLEADMVLDDPVAEVLASAGTLAISTCFKSIDVPDGDGNYVITGTVKPDHVLAFEQGVAPNCYPNDQGAMMTNQVEVVHTMTDTKTGLTEEDKGFFENLFAKFHKNQNSEVELREDATVDIEELKREIEELKRQLAERDAIIAEMKNAEEQKQKDDEWDCMKNQCPEGWLADEAATRAEFEKSPALFASKLAAHLTKFANMQQKAEGNVNANQLPPVDPTEAYIESVGNKFGFKF